MADKSHKGGKKGKAPDCRPARARYWLSKKLREKKVYNIMYHGKHKVQDEHTAWEFRTNKGWVKCGKVPKAPPMHSNKALRLWLESRQRGPYDSMGLVQYKARTR